MLCHFAVIYLGRLGGVMEAKRSLGVRMSRSKLVFHIYAADVPGRM